MKLGAMNPELASYGWRPAFKEPGAANSYLRINTVMGANQPWIFARLDELKRGWKVVISYRAPGRDCLLLVFEEELLFKACRRAQETIDAYEASMRMGWVP